MKDAILNRHLRHIKAALRWAERQGLLTKAPFIEMPKRAKGQSQAKGPGQWLRNRDRGAARRQRGPIREGVVHRRANRVLGHPGRKSFGHSPRPATGTRDVRLRKNPIGRPLHLGRIPAGDVLVEGVSGPREQGKRTASNSRRVELIWANESKRRFTEDHETRSQLLFWFRRSRLLGCVCFTKAHSL